MKPVAVTGATGFIGSAVVRKLVAQGRTVRALVEPGADPKNLEGLAVERMAGGHGMVVAWTDIERAAVPPTTAP